MCGGGGVSGAISLPGYMSDTHALLMHDLLTNNAGDYTGGITTGVFDLKLETIVNDAWTSDAYSGFVFTSPTTDLALSKTQFNSFYSHVTGLVHTTDWKAIITVAAAELKSCPILEDVSIEELTQSAIRQTTNAVEEALEVAQALVDDDILQLLVTQFEDRQAIPRGRAVAQFNQQMVDGNAVHSSAFLFGHALLQSEFTRQTADYNAQINTAAFQTALQSWIQGWIRQSQMESFTRQNNLNQRTQTLREGIGSMVRMLTNEVEFERSASVVLTDQNRVKVIALAEHEERDLSRDVSADLWDIQMLGESVQILGAPAGAAARLPAKPSRISSALGGGLQGAAAGAVTGAGIAAAGGPITAAGGAAIGGIAGLLGGLTQ